MHACTVRVEVCTDVHVPFPVDVQISFVKNAVDVSEATLQHAVM